MNKKLYLIPVAIAGITLVACGGGGKKPTPSFQYDVSIDDSIDAFELDKYEATANADFDATLSVKDEYVDYCGVPTSLDEVRVNGNILDSDCYTYKASSKTSASIHIPSDYVIGDIEIAGEPKGDKIGVKLSELGTVTPETLSINREEALIGSSFQTNILLEEGTEGAYKKTLSVPDSIDDFAITCRDEGDHNTYDLTSCCRYVKHDDALGTLTIPAKYNGVVVITGNVEIKTKSHKPSYTAKTAKEPLDNLDVDFDERVPYKGTEYTFKLSTVSYSDYSVPEMLNITVGGIPLSLGDDGYTIEKTDNDNATVKIAADCVQGDIIVDGQGAKDSITKVEQYLAGLEEIATETRTGTDCIIPFKATAGHAAPEASDIRVRVGDGKGVDEWKEVNQDGITYSDNTLTIPASLVTNKGISIAARAHDVKLLEFYSSYGDWESIELASNLGYAPHLFEVGEESVPFSLNGDTSNAQYKIRLLDFNRDTNYVVGNKAGMTFEFTTCISQQYFSKSTTEGYKSNSTYFYKKDGISYQSALYDYLNKNLYDALPFKKYVNSVDKYTVTGSYVTTGQGKAVTSNNYLFPLSLKELGITKTATDVEYAKETPSGDGEPYAYYQNSAHSLVKTDGTEAVTYWVRSPANVNQAQVCTITKEGKQSSSPARSLVYVAPAFCM